MGGIANECSRERRPVSGLRSLARSRLRLQSFEDSVIFKAIDVRVVSVDLDDLGNEAPAGTALDVEHDIKRIRDIGFDGFVGKLDTTLQNATCEAGKSLSCGVGVNGR